MKRYIDGFYCRDDVDLKILNKTTNRDILNALQEVHPSGLTVKEISDKSGRPEKTIYTQQAELYDKYFINLLKQEGKTGGRPTSEFTAERYRRKVIIEEAKGIYDIYEGKKPVPLPPGNALVNEDFKKAWSKILEKEQQEELSMSLLYFLQKAFNKISNHNNKEVREWAPKKERGCCIQCGLNHEARDFMRSLLLCVIDEVENHMKFVDFMKDNEFLTQEAYKRIKGKELKAV
jgi:hypothetical protein